MADMVVDTYKLKQYAQRLKNVNARIGRLDMRLDTLYTKVGLLELWNLIQADALMGYSWRLKRCQEYLNQTAAEFESVENSILEKNPENMDGYRTGDLKVLETGREITGKYGYDILDFLFKNTGLKASYVGFYGTEFEEKIKEYKELFSGDLTMREKSDGVIKWLSGIRKDASTYKDYIEYLTGDELEWNSPLKDSFDFIKALDTYNKFGTGLLDYGIGLYNGDTAMATKGADNLLSGIKGTISKTLKTKDPMTNYKSGLILDYGKNMISNWLQSIASETEVSEVYWNTFANSALDVFNDKICNTPTLAIAYFPARGVSGVFGYDLQGAYEKVSDKKGFAAVTDSVGQLHDIIRENSTWENWKSGMGLIIDRVGGLFK